MKRIRSKNTTTGDGKPCVAIYVGRKLAATLHFPAKNCDELRDVEEAIALLWKETHDQELR